MPCVGGMFRGRATSELTVAVRVNPNEGTPQGNRIWQHSEPNGCRCL